jgi:tetratricopeptide (TPR) repeat protein
MRATCLSEQCTIRDWFWVVFNGLNVITWANNALNLDPRNAEAQYLNACRYAYAPSGIAGGDPKKGITLLTEMLNGATELPKNLLFDVYAGIAYAHERLDNIDEAKVWLSRALRLYPTNKFAGEELYNTLYKK